MPTRLANFVRGSTVYVPLAWTRDGAAIDLTGATLFAQILALATSPDSAALCASDDAGPVLVFVNRDDLAGLATLKFLPGATSDIRQLPAPVWQARATLASGEVVALNAHLGPISLTPPQGSTIDNTWSCDATIDCGGDAQSLVVASANYVLNRADITRLTGSLGTDLAGLSADTLASYATGAVVRLFFAGSIVTDWRLRLRATAPSTESAQHRVFCVNDATRLWERIAISKEGASCAWDADLGKFKQILVAGGAITLADDADAFLLPVA